LLLAGLAPRKALQRNPHMETGNPLEGEHSKNNHKWGRIIIILADPEIYCIIRTA
jgi:hypothetical protein